MGLVIKAALGALVVLLIGVLAKTKNYYIAGLIPLFPTFALIAHYIVASERGIEALRATIIFSMWSIIPYFVNVDLHHASQYVGQWRTRFFRHPRTGVMQNSTQTMGAF